MKTTKIKLEMDMTFHNVDCENDKCKNNLLNIDARGWGCNLKRIKIHKDGYCDSYVPLE